MSALDNIQLGIAPDLHRLNDRISSSLNCNNPLMQKIIDGYLESKGKMIRPILVMLAAKLFAAVDDRVISAAAAVEMLHNASLIHDDVVDESKMRRDRPTLNALWDNHIAVLVGDYFVSSALQQAISTADVRIISSLARLGRLLSLGEIDQLYNARYHNLDEESYFGVISYKTASLFVSCVEMGAYAVGAPEERIEPLRRYAELLGRCFQIKDDIFDYFDDPRVGKPTGNDLREGKVTLPLLHALTTSADPRRPQMEELIRHEQLTDAEITALIEFARHDGGIEYAYSVMDRMRDEASDALHAAFPDCEARRALDSVFDFIIERTY